MYFPESSNKVIQEDLELIADKLKDHLDFFTNKSILITGSTGLIGHYLVLAVLTLARLNKFNCTVIAQGRSRQKLETTFKDVLHNSNLILWTSNLSETLEPPFAIDYIIHAASPTASKDFIEKPVEVIDSIYQSTRSILHLAQSKAVKSLVYLSSMEMYGQFTRDVPIFEHDCGQLDVLALRSSYPQAKRLAELLCFSFAKEKLLPIKIARLSMIFGPGVSKTDKRVLNYFTQQIRASSPIILQTPGKSKASVLYIREAVEGIFYLLILGTNSDVYNLANPANYYSIHQMAEIAASINNIQVTIKSSENPNSPYPKETFLNLDISKMKKLGWNPEISLKNTFLRTLDSQNNH